MPNQLPTHACGLPMVISIAMAPLYNQVDINSALELVRKGVLVERAARRLGIPKTTLQR
ncbi:hypothetical protein B0H67DRAFT_578227 [Lasiosphaeris hirsuta]|uniref:HTH psq-type domain-containing protein n=1 Tax=Lasiosphaeris hirsuta TaxID=260670 RepID=A0AA40ASI3_9PEZI|nr:hypothetical protein B0H67DRAFT_578227 [Lasiosphaeris hirsuta]